MRAAVAVAVAVAAVLVLALPQGTAALGIEASNAAGCCEDVLVDWADKNGDSCADYEDLRFCEIDGSEGPTWKSRWGTFEDYASNGLTAAEACCVCGGGKKIACVSAATLLARNTIRSSGSPNPDASTQPGSKESTIARSGNSTLPSALPEKQKMPVTYVESEIGVSASANLKTKKGESSMTTSNKQANVTDASKTYFKLNNAGTYDLLANDKHSIAVAHASSESTTPATDNRATTISNGVDGKANENTKIRSTSTTLPLTTFVTPNNGFTSSVDKTIEVSTIEGTKRNLTQAELKKILGGTFYGKSGTAKTVP